nr:MAG TPA: hypothetical protein [Caudoviricetes sp.]DAO60904.1 MAG TPA: hypothetical protein [Herelleviridae sp.]
MKFSFRHIKLESCLIPFVSFLYINLLEKSHVTY